MNDDAINITPNWPNFTEAAKMAQMQEFITSHAPSMAQVAGITTLRDGEPFIADSLTRYRALRDLVTIRLHALPGATIARSQGSFYTFFRLPQSADSLAFCKELLLDTGVTLAPGKAFGAGGEGWLRLCFANEPDRLNRAFDALEAWLQRQRAALCQRGCPPRGHGGSPSHRPC